MSADNSCLLLGINYRSVFLPLQQLKVNVCLPGLFQAQLSYYCVIRWKIEVCVFHYVRLSDGKGRGVTEEGRRGKESLWHQLYLRKFSKMYSQFHLYSWSRQWLYFSGRANALKYLMDRGLTFTFKDKEKNLKIDGHLFWDDMHDLIVHFTDQNWFCVCFEIRYATLQLHWHLGLVKATNFSVTVWWRRDWLVPKWHQAKLKHIMKNWKRGDMGNLRHFDIHFNFCLPLKMVRV